MNDMGKDLSLESTESGRNPKYKWLVLGLAFLVWMTNYTDKTVMAVVAPRLMKDLDISKIEIGFIFASFALTYTILQPLLSWLADVVGPRKSVGTMVLSYGLFTILTGVFSLNLGILAWMRAATGAGEASSLSAATGGVSRWMPKSRSHFAQGVLHSAVMVGSAITLPISVWGIYTFGIAGPFWIFGTGTILVGLLWLGLYYEPHKLSGNGNNNKINHGKLLWIRILRSRSLWVLSIVDFCYFYTFTIYVTWLPTFLIKDRHFTLIKVGIYGFLPFIAGIFGCLSGGFVCDWIVLRTRRPKLWRRLMPSMTMVASVALLIPAVYSSHQFLTIMYFSFSFVFLAATPPILWAISMDMGGAYASSTTGWMNTWANVGGILSPIIFGVLVQKTGSWILPFWVASLLMLIGAGLMWLLDTEERISLSEADH